MKSCLSLREKKKASRDTQILKNNIFIRYISIKKGLVYLQASKKKNDQSITLVSPQIAELGAIGILNPARWNHLTKSNKESTLPNTIIRKWLQINNDEVTKGANQTKGTCSIYGYTDIIVKKKN